MADVQLRKEQQLNPIQDEVSALIAIVRPILLGLLYALKRDMVGQVGGYEKVALNMLARLYRPGDGDVGICFEYAVHDAILRNYAPVREKIVESLSRRYCNVPGHDTASILFGAEKYGAIQIIETATNVLTDDSRLLTGQRAQPIKLKNYINRLAAAFRRPRTRLSLPTSINGLWKADLFLGNTDSDRWVGTTVKINPAHLEGASGLRVGIIPSQYAGSDRIRIDEGKNLVICPLPYDGSFMEIFYMAWGIVQQFIRADARVPGEVYLPIRSHRMVAQNLEDRRDFPVLDVVEALAPLAQPELLSTAPSTGSVELQTDAASITTAIIAPISREIPNGASRLRRIAGPTR